MACLRLLRLFVQSYTIRKSFTTFLRSFSCFRNVTRREFFTCPPLIHIQGLTEGKAHRKIGKGPIARRLTFDHKKSTCYC